MLAQRLITQGLAGPPRANVADVVGNLLAVQAQDAPLTRWSLAMRTGHGSDPDLRAALDSGSVVRTHVLRPTWHLVPADDLRWLLALTSPRVVSSMRAQRRRLGLDDADVVAREHTRLADALRDHRYLSRRELAREDLRGERLGTMLLLAELDGLICSGPLDTRGQHTYALVEERVPPAPARDRDDAIRELVLRFFTGHGPASVAHLVRWARLVTREVSAALADLGSELTSTELDGVTLWFAPQRSEKSSTQATSSPHPAASGTWLLPVFDEVYLSYPGSSFPRVTDHPWGASDHHFAESGGGVVISDLQDIGWWRRTEAAAVTTVVVGLASSIGAARRRAVAEQAESLARFTGRRLELVHA